MILFVACCDGFGMCVTVSCFESVCACECVCAWVCFWLLLVSLQCAACAGVVLESFSLSVR